MSEQSITVLGQINLVVADMQATVRFYRLLGLDIDENRQFGEHHQSVKMPNGFLLEIDSVAFARKWNQGCRGTNGPTANVIGFNTETRAAVDALYAKLTDAGYGSQQPPFDAFWGARYAVVEDPDQNPIGLMSPIDPTRRAAPPV